MSEFWVLSLGLPIEMSWIQFRYRAISGDQSEDGVAFADFGDVHRNYAPDRIGGGELQLLVLAAHLLDLRVFSEGVEVVASGDEEGNSSSVYLGLEMVVGVVTMAQSLGHKRRVGEKEVHRSL